MLVFNWFSFTTRLVIEFTSNVSTSASAHTARLTNNAGLTVSDKPPIRWCRRNFVRVLSCPNVYYRAVPVGDMMLSTGTTVAIRRHL
jgi:hypothetical protein